MIQALILVKKNMKTKITILLLTLFHLYSINAQTILSPGDIAIIGFSTTNRNDAVKLVSLVDLECGTTFILTDNNWRNNNSWYCNNEEFGVQLTVTSLVLAGSVIYVDVDASSGTASVSTGGISKTNLGNPWGTNYGLNAGGDNLFVLQGTRLAPNFIFALRHSGTFSSGGDCSEKDYTSKPTNLTIGVNAIEMSSSKDQWHFNCATGITSGSKAAILASIGNNANWTSASTWIANTTTCTFYLNDASTYGYISGSMNVVGAGCGCLANCDLSAIQGANCGVTGITGDCSSGMQSVFEEINVPNGCTYTIYAIMQNWTSCSASGADAGDGLKVDLVGGSKSFKTGTNNAILTDNFTATGPATIRISLNANRADEIATYRVVPSTCASCSPIALPVELLDFNAEKIENNIRISWGTASEKNVSHFIVEKSKDAFNWEHIGFKSATGNSSSYQMYQLYDTDLNVGIVYYRLKEIDFDGREYQSQIVAVDANSSKKKPIRFLNLLGQEVSENEKGMVLILFEDGSIEKKYN